MQSKIEPGILITSFASSCDREEGIFCVTVTVSTHYALLKVALVDRRTRPYR